ncbi:SprT-like family-domain-containing protein [Hypoxylon cercidicola]|nr:SprT-like family-domain-containing protein [Hypoxylon cercidicola]
MNREFSFTIPIPTQGIVARHGIDRKNTTTNMLDEYGGSSEDEFPDIDVLIRQYQHKVRDTAGQAGAKENAPATLATRSHSMEDESVKSNTGVKATPLRRRKLGQSQTVDRSLLKPWNGVTGKEKDLRDSNFGGSRARARGTAETNTSSRVTSKSVPAKANKAGLRAVSLGSNQNTLAKEKEKPKQNGGQGGQTKDTKLTEEIKELVALLGEFDNEESDVLGEKKEPCEEDSEFVSISDSESDRWGSGSEISSSQPTRRSRSPDDKWARPQRTLFASPGKKAASSNKQTKTTITDPAKHASKTRRQDDSRPQSFKASQTEDLQDAFERLQIFNEDSEPDKPSTGGDKKPYLILEPMTPKKTLPASPFKTPKIPKSPWKPEHKEFWDPEKNFGWIDKHSPEKKLESPKKKQGQDGTNPETKRTNAEKRAMKKAFDAAKEEMARTFLQELDSRITDGQLTQLTKDTGGLQIMWSNTLNSTAGRAHWKCKTIPTTHPDGSTDQRKQQYASIELASKVLTNETDLLNTVAHEFCHLAVFILNGKPKMAHGLEFKSWGALCERVFKNRGIVVTTKHNYEIEYKYVWKCADCTLEVKRHSKSVNTETRRCGKCKGRLLQIKPTPRNRSGPSPTPGSLDTDREKGGDQVATTTAKKQPSQWQLFMASEMKTLAQTNKSMPFKDRMAAVAAKWRALPEHEKQGQKGQTGLKELQSAVEILTIDDEL